MNALSAFWPKLRLWHWAVAIAGFLFWTDTMINWARGEQILLVVPVLYSVLLSPLLVIPSAIWTIRRYQQKRINRSTMYWRLIWATALLVNFVGVLWVAGAFK